MPQSVSQASQPPVASENIHAEAPGISLAPVPRAPALPAEQLLVCLQHPFEGVGDSSTIVRVTVPTGDGNSTQLWQLEVVMEMNAPRVFAGWATRSVFTLDLSVHATVSPASGTWGGTIRTSSGTGVCRIIVMPESTNKVRFSFATGTHHAPEKPLPSPDTHRFLNADIAFELNDSSSLTAAAVAVVSNKNWSHLIAGSSVATQGLAFDGKWRQKLDPFDGDATVLGAWAFAVMTPQAYAELCTHYGWAPYVL
jgi:hypothetical protein